MAQMSNVAVPCFNGESFLAEGSTHSGFPSLERSTEGVIQA